jgi:hypothetical protein
MGSLRRFDLECGLRLAGELLSCLISESGAFSAGSGGNQLRNAETLRAGDTAYTPAGVHHYWVARGPTVVALTFDGPYTITYVNAYEAPKGTSFPHQY